MGRGSLLTPRAKFHSAKDVTALFDGRVPPEQLAKNAWWHFLSITVPGGEEDLLQVYDRLLVMFQDLRFADFPILEGPSEFVDAELLEDLSRLWPALAVENP